MKLVIDFICDDGSRGSIRSDIESVSLFEAQECPARDFSAKSETSTEGGVRAKLSVSGGRFKCSLSTARPIVLKRAAIECSHAYSKSDKVFVNGYQSWTESREYLCPELVHNMNKVPRRIKKKFNFEEYGDPWFYRYEKDTLHGFTYSYIDRADGCHLIGSLNEANAFLIIMFVPSASQLILESDVAGRKVEGEFPLFDFLCICGGKVQVQKEYFARLGKCSAQPIRGYTSWYNHYQDINEAKLRTALSGISSEQYDVFQIDDGFETFVGDWFDIDKNKFPEGLKPLVDDIHARGLKAGIWLAPFVAEKKSRLFAEHPDWLLRRGGQIVFAGCNWSGDAALDVRNEDVRQYVRSVLKFYADMGFDLFKLDFLYAAALCAGDSVRMGTDEDGSSTRAEIMRSSMELLRECLEDKLILGCGVPLSSAFNLVDYCRVGPDISLSFDDVFYMRQMHRERVSTKVTLVNSIYRSCMDGTVFRCDPDVYLLRDDNIKLSAAQKEAIVRIDHLCGAVAFTSDDAAGYDEARKALLADARRLANAEITSIERTGSLITVGFLLDGSADSITYDMEKGVLAQ